MTFKKCKNDGCEIQIEVRNTAEGWRPFEESGNKHNCQFSDYAKKQRAKEAAGPIPTTEYLEKLEQKNDHGNELTESRQNNAWKTSNVGTNTLSEQEKLGYVDHTQPQKLKHKTFTDATPEGLDLKINTFGETHDIRYSQFHPLPSLYTEAVWYSEEISK